MRSMTLTTPSFEGFMARPMPLPFIAAAATRVALPGNHAGRKAAEVLVTAEANGISTLRQQAVGKERPGSGVYNHRNVVAVGNLGKCRQRELSAGSRHVRNNVQRGCGVIRNGELHLLGQRAVGLAKFHGLGAAEVNHLRYRRAKPNRVPLLNDDLILHAAGIGQGQHFAQDVCRSLPLRTAP